MSLVLPPTATTAATDLVRAREQLAAAGESVSRWRARAEVSRAALEQTVPVLEALCRQGLMEGLADRVLDEVVRALAINDGTRPDVDVPTQQDLFARSSS